MGLPKFRAKAKFPQMENNDYSREKRFSEAEIREQDPKFPYLSVPDKREYGSALHYKKLRTDGTGFGSYELGLSDLVREIKERIKITNAEIFDIGEMLCLARPLWNKIRKRFKYWIIENFDFSYETAINFIHVYQQCMGIRSIVMHLPHSVLYQISKPSFPEELRDYLLSQGNLVVLSCKHVDAIYRKYLDSGYTFDSIESDLTELNNKYYVFRQTRENIELCDKAKKCC